MKERVGKISFRSLPMFLVLALILGGVSSCSRLSITPSTSSTALPTIKILGTISLSGDVANLEPPYNRAIRMVVGELNEAGIPGFTKR